MQIHVGLEREGGGEGRGMLLCVLDPPILTHKGRHFGGRLAKLINGVRISSGL